MGLLARIVLRTSARNWVQFAAVLVMALAAVGVHAGLEGAWRGLQVAVDQFTSQARLADAWVSASEVTDDDLRAIESLPGVEAAQTTRAVPTSDERHSGQVLLETIGASGIDQPQVLAGEPIDDGPGIWLDANYAGVHAIAPGDQLELTVLGQPIWLRVRGLVLAADKVFFAWPGQVVPDAEEYGYAVLTEQSLHADLGLRLPANRIQVRGDAASVRTAVPDLLAERYRGFADRATQPTVAPAFERADQIRTLSLLFVSIFVFLALLSMQTSIRRLVDLQAVEIATLRALGHRTRTIGWLYLSYGLISGGVGALLGLAAAPSLARMLLTAQQSVFGLPDLGPAWTIWTPLVVVGVITSCALTAWLASAKARRQVPAAGLRPVAGGGRHLAAERSRAWQRLDTASRWAIRDAVGAPLRLSLGVLAVVGSMMLLIAGFGVPRSMVQLVETSYGGDYRYTGRVEISGQATAADRDRLSQVAGSQTQWLMQRPVRSIPDDGFDRTLTVLGPGDLVALTAAGQRVDLAGGPLISTGAARDWRLEPGDPIEVRAVGDLAYRRFEVAAVIDIALPQGIFISDADWRAAGGSFLPTTVLTGPDWDEAALRADPAVLEVATLAEQAASACQIPQNLAGIYHVMKGSAVVLAIVALYNLGALSFSERARQYATLQVLGMRISEIRGLVLAENLATTALGWLTGLGVGWWFLQRYVAVFASPSIEYVAVLSWADLGWASMVAVGSALSTTLLLSRRIRSLDMAASLKGVE